MLQPSVVPIADFQKLQSWLEEKVSQFNIQGFIADDPISIPHGYTRQDDQEIMGFFAAILAWGQRKTIISKCRELHDRMGGEPARFIREHRENDLKALTGFVHRTFSDTDLLYFVQVLQRWYCQEGGLEEAFCAGLSPEDEHVEKALIRFRERFFSFPDAPQRTRKHIASPAAGSACKRLVMYLRWMVRKDDRGVDFGHWKRIRSDQLICPCDLHVDRTARALGLITRTKTDWLAALELTRNLKIFDPVDPVRFDFALFGIGLENKGRL